MKQIKVLMLITSLVLTVFTFATNKKRKSTPGKEDSYLKHPRTNSIKNIDELTAKKEQNKILLKNVLTQWFDFYCPLGKRPLAQMVLGLPQDQVNHQEEEEEIIQQEDSKIIFFSVEAAGSGIILIKKLPVSAKTTVGELKATIKKKLSNEKNRYNIPKLFLGHGGPELSDDSKKIGNKTTANDTPLVLAWKNIADYQAMIMAKFYTLASNSRLSRWTEQKLRGNPIKDWPGVTVDEGGYITKINLCFSSLTGPIPESLGYLNELRFLYLHNNQLTGPIPEELGKLQNLEHLYLQENNLTGLVPTELGGLVKLKKLNLKANKLTELSEFKKLTNEKVPNCQVSVYPQKALQGLF